MAVERTIEITEILIAPQTPQFEVSEEEPAEIKDDKILAKELNICQAAYHAPQFYDEEGFVIPHTANSRDHLTPKRIARLQGWHSDDYKAPNELISVNNACHSLKDSSTKARIELLIKIIGSKKIITLADYKEFRKKYDRVYLVNRNGNGNHK